jgi:hypothetical protein
VEQRVVREFTPDLEASERLVLKRVQDDGRGAALVLETLLPMPGEEMRVRPIHRPRRRQRAPALVDQAPHAVRIIYLPRHKNVEFVRKPDQPAIEPIRTRSS